MSSSVRFMLARAIAVASALTPAASHAGSCDPVEKAIESGMRQPRIYAAAFELTTDAKPGKASMSAVTIDRTHYLFDGRRNFGPTPLESDELRRMGSGLVGFSPGETCRPLGAESVAGRSALKFAYVTDLGNGPTNVTLWIDRASNLPLRGITDEPEMDVDVGFSKDGDLETRKRPTGKRSRHVSAFLFGDAVKAPVKKQIDPGMQAAIQELLR